MCKLQSFVSLGLKCLTRQYIDDRLIQPLPFFNSAFSQVIVFSNLLSVLHHSHILSGNILSKPFAPYFCFLARIRSNAFFHVKSHYGNNVFSDVTIMSFVRSFVRYCRQGSSLLWTQARRPSRGPMRLPRRDEGNRLVCASMCVTCRVRRVK